MRLKLDENLGQRGAELLRRAGHDVATVIEQGLQSTFDPDLIEICRTEARCLGEIVRSPTDNSHTYQIQLPSGVMVNVLPDASSGSCVDCVNLRRHEFSIRKHYQREGLQRSEDVLPDYSLYDAVIYRCIVGSRAYELDNAESDVDRRGIYLPAADQYWSLYGVPWQVFCSKGLS